MKSHHFMVAFAVTAAIVAAVALLRRPTRIIETHSEKVETTVQSLIEADASATQNLTLEEREKRADQLVKQLDSPGLIERKRELGEARKEFARTNARYEELNAKYSQQLLESHNPEQDLELERVFREAQTELNRLREQADHLSKLTAQFNNELLARAVSKYGAAAQTGDAI